MKLTVPRRPKGSEFSHELAKVSSALLLPVLLALVGALAIYGAITAVGIFSGGDRASDTYAIAQDIPTSFGVVAVEYVQKTPGLTAKQLGGMTHGIQSNIPPDKVQVQANVVMTNTTNHTVDYSPKQFGMTSGDGEKIALSGGTLQGGTLQPDASISGMVSFVAPRDGSNQAIEFKESKDGKDIVIDLGRTDKTPENAFDGYHNHGAEDVQGEDKGSKQDGRSPPSN